MKKQKALDILEDNLRKEGGIEKNTKDPFTEYRESNNQVTDISNYILNVTKDLKLSDAHLLKREL